jgi:hypothetical protein
MPMLSNSHSSRWRPSRVEGPQHAPAPCAAGLSCRRVFHHPRPRRGRVPCTLLLPRRPPCPGTTMADLQEKLPSQLCSVTVTGFTLMSMYKTHQGCPMLGLPDVATCGMCCAATEVANAAAMLLLSQNYVCTAAAAAAARRGPCTYMMGIDWLGLLAVVLTVQEDQHSHICYLAAVLPSELVMVNDGRTMLCCRLLHLQCIAPAQI